MLENAGIIANTWFKIETVLAEQKAFDPVSAVSAELAQINFTTALEMMERGGFLGRTSDGKVFLTKKGKDRQVRGFAINVIPPHTIVKYSKNK